jgi:hypothetical protein
MINGITHSTIGMCSQCTDITSELQDYGTNGTVTPAEYCPDGYLALPNGLMLQNCWIDYGSGVFNASGEPYNSLDSLFSQVEDLSFTILPASVFNWTMITLSGFEADGEAAGNNTKYLSTACSIYSCMKHYAGLVDRGNFNEILVSTVPALRLFFMNDSTSFYAGINASCVIDGNTYDLTRIQPNQIGISQDGSLLSITLGGGDLTLPSECINEMDFDYVYSLASVLAEVLTGSCEMLFDFADLPCSGSWWLGGGLWNSGNATLDTVQATFVRNTTTPQKGALLLSVT